MLISQISAPVISAKFAISLIKLIFIARNEFAAYLMISDDFTEVKRSGAFVRINGLYTSSIASCARGVETQQTIRSGVIKSFTAAPSRKNSGLLTMSNSVFIPRD